MINIVYRLVAPGIIESAPVETDIRNVVVTRPEYLSICKADRRYYLGERSREALKEKLPMALLHECAASVVFDPTGTYRTGELVVPVPNVPTRDDDVIAENYRASSYFCSSGSDGFLRDYVDMPPDRLVRVPKGMNPKVASFTELISVAVHAVSRFDRFAHSRRNAVGVWGDGNLGFIVSLVLKVSCPDSKIYVFGTDYEKLSYFTFADGAFQIDKIPDCLEIDHAFECVGGEASRSAIAQIIDLVSPEGAIGLMGVSENRIAINTRTTLEKGLCLFGSSRSGITDFRRTMEIIENNPTISSRLENIIGEVVETASVADIHKAFSSDIGRRFGKTVLKWNK